MKNYLFAPFKDDEEKIEEFNHFKNYLSSGHRNSLIMFIGRLESYYDVTIEELKLLSCSDDCQDDVNSLINLRAENKRLNKLIYAIKEETQADIETLKAENKELRNSKIEVMTKAQEEIRKLKADIKHDADICHDVDDKHIKEIERLKAESIELKVAIKWFERGGYDADEELQAKDRKAIYEKAYAEKGELDKSWMSSLEESARKHVEENKRLKDVITLQNADIIQADKQYHLMASSKQYQAEADEYFHNNPQSKGVRFHMIDFSDYDYDDDNNGMNGGGGEYTLTLYAEECLIEIDNTEGGN